MQWSPSFKENVKKIMGVEKDEGCFMLKVDPWGRKQTDGKWGSENFLLKVYLKKLCHKISQNADGVNWHKIKGTWILDLKSGTLFPGPSGHLQKIPQDTVLPIGPGLYKPILTLLSDQYFMIHQSCDKIHYSPFCNWQVTACALAIPRLHPVAFQFLQ